MLVNENRDSEKTGTVEEIAKEDKKLQLRMIDLNCRGLTEMTCTCLPWMHKGTRIINLASRNMDFFARRQNSQFMRRQSRMY